MFDQSTSLSLMARPSASMLKGGGGTIEANWRSSGRWLFLFLCTLYLLNSTERGILPATLNSIIFDLDLGSSEAGSFESFFVVGLTLFLLAWSSLYRKIKKTFLILGMGYSLWFLSCFGCAFSQTYLQFAVSRLVCGAGDAAMNVLGVPWVDANAPAAKRASFVAVFAMMFIIGDASGMIVGGQITAWDGNPYGWRTCFFGIACITLPWIIFAYCVDLRRHVTATVDDIEVDEMSQQKPRGGHGHGGEVSCSGDMIALLKNPLVVMAVLGVAAFQTMVAIVGYWSNVFMINTLGVPQAQAATGLGFTILAATFVGVPIGGTLLDGMGRRHGGKTVTLAFAQGAFFTIFGIGFMLAAFGFMETLLPFLGCLAAAYMFFMIGASAITPGTLWIVAPERRVPLSALVVFGFNLLGKIPGPLIIGALLDTQTDTGDNSTETMSSMSPEFEGEFPRWIICLGPLWVSWSVIFWALVAILSKRWGVGRNIDGDVSEPVDDDHSYASGYSETPSNYSTFGQSEASSTADYR